LTIESIFVFISDLYVAVDKWSVDLSLLTAERELD